MFELTINNEVYQLNFGMGFLREMNQKISVPVDGMPGVKKNVGLRYGIANVIDGDIETLEEVIDLANKGQKPRLTKKILDEHIENEDTDVDGLFDTVVGFLKTANVTRKETKSIMDAVAEAEKKEA